MHKIIKLMIQKHNFKRSLWCGALAIRAPEKSKETKTEISNISDRNQIHFQKMQSRAKKTEKKKNARQVIVIVCGTQRPSIKNRKK